jgi:hypothetical protein
MVEMRRSSSGDVVIFADNAQSLLAACPWLAADPFWAEVAPALFGSGDRFVLEAPVWYLAAVDPEVVLYDWEDGRGTQPTETAESYGWTDRVDTPLVPTWWRQAHVAYFGDGADR